MSVSMLSTFVKPMHREGRKFVSIFAGVTLILFLIWAAIGLAVYFGYSRSRSHVGRGIIDVPEHEAYEDLDPPVPGTR